jgi:hypothetical protein
MSSQANIEDGAEQLDQLIAKRGAGEKEKRENTSDKLIAIGLNSDLFHDERNDAYGCVMHGKTRMTLRLRSRAFKRWVANRYWQEHKSAPNNEALSTAMNVLEAKACYEGGRLELSNRFAVRDGAVYIDLCDDAWRAMKITAIGWEVMDKPPVVFRRYAHQSPLPIPERGGSLDQLDEFLNIKTVADRIMMKGWLVTAALQHIPRPALTLHGSQGSGKTTAARVLRRLLDPSAIDNLSFTSDPTQLAQVLDHHAVPCFDNLKTIDAGSADMLCRAVTGGGFSKRELFTDAEDIVFTFKRSLIINGINIPSHAPDLLDRMLLIELDRVPEDDRRTEKEFWRAFDVAHAKLFGALLDAMVVMLATNFESERLPRLADFALSAARWADGSGIGGQKFLNDYATNIGRQTEEAIESECVGCAVRNLVEVHGDWQGTPGELYKLLNERRNGPVPADWPKRENSLSKRIRVLQATLSDVGVRVTFSKSGPRTVRLERVGKQPSEPSMPSKANIDAGFRVDGSKNQPSVNRPSTVQPSVSRPAVQQPSGLKPNTGAGLDSTDGLDGSKVSLSGAAEFEPLTQAEIDELEIRQAKRTLARARAPL